MISSCYRYNFLVEKSPQLANPRNIILELANIPISHRHKKFAQNLQKFADANTNILKYYQCRFSKKCRFRS